MGMNEEEKLRALGENRNLILSTEEKFAQIKAYPPYIILNKNVIIAVFYLRNTPQCVFFGERPGGRRCHLCVGEPRRAKNGENRDFFAHYI